MACIDSTVSALDSRCFVTFSSIHRNASIELTTKSPSDRFSSTSHIKQRFKCSGNQTVSARQWHGHSPCVRLMLLRLRSPEASNRGSNSIIFSCVMSFSSMAGALFYAFPIIFFLSKSLVFFLFPNSRAPPPRSHSSLFFDLQALLLVSSAIACESGATFMPIVRFGYRKSLVD